MANPRGNALKSPTTTLHTFDYISAIKRKTELAAQAAKKLEPSQSLPVLKTSIYSNTAIHAALNTAVIHQPSKRTLSYIHCATHGDYDGMLKLEKKGVKLSKVVDHDRTLLFQAINAYCHHSKTSTDIEGYKKVVCHLSDFAQKHSQWDLLGVVGKRGNTGLHLAATHNDLWLAQTLVNRGANKNSFNDLGYRPCEWGKMQHGEGFDKELRKLLAKDLVWLPSLGFNHQAKALVKAEVPNTNSKAGVQLPSLNINTP